MESLALFKNFPVSWQTQIPLGNFKLRWISNHTGDLLVQKSSLNQMTITAIQNEPCKCFQFSCSYQTNDVKAQCLPNSLQITFAKMKKKNLLFPVLTTVVFPLLSLREQRDLVLLNNCSFIVKRSQSWLWGTGGEQNANHQTTFTFIRLHQGQRAHII